MWADEQSALPALILERPSATISALSFETFNLDYAQSLELLETIAKTFNYLDI